MGVANSLRRAFSMCPRCHHQQCLSLLLSSSLDAFGKRRFCRNTPRFGFQRPGWRDQTREFNDPWSKKSRGCDPGCHTNTHAHLPTRVPRLSVLSFALRTVDCVGVVDDWDLTEARCCAGGGISALPGRIVDRHSKAKIKRTYIQAVGIDGWCCMLCVVRLLKIVYTTLKYSLLAGLGDLLDFIRVDDAVDRGTVVTW